MLDSIRFQRELAARLLGIVGAVSLAALPVACDGAGEATSISGGGGAGSAATTSSTGDSGAATVQECFKWAPDLGPCPTYEPTVLAQFTCCGCPTGGWEPSKIDSPPTVNGDGDCCYQVERELCSQGGRPYLVDDRARVAAVDRIAGARGWCLGERPRVDDLAVEERAALAEAWTADALLEHASVASFSRFALALLAAGAPADLVELAHRAALDEVRHARLCFALASAYAGEDVAPGPFPLGGDVRVGASLVAIAVSTVKEGCVGETVAAVVAAEQLARATDPAVRAALAQIAEDEARHAELAWRTVAWAVRTGGRDVRASVARALFQALAGSRRAEGRDASALGSVPSGSDVLEAHGRLDRATVSRVAAAAMANIVAPAAEALFQVEVTS